MEPDPPWAEVCREGLATKSVSRAFGEGCMDVKIELKGGGERKSVMKGLDGWRRSG